MFPLSGQPAVQVGGKEEVGEDKKKKNKMIVGLFNVSIVSGFRLPATHFEEVLLR